jgi:hypothetical protein
MDGIPEDWLEKVSRKSDIAEVMKKFYEYCAIRAIINQNGTLY